ncbi:MAG TPA: type I-B CRISPR-associated protein Cas8b1/Cst1 [Tissierellaceae bacterium]|nr:type I-B CRISPR-associated protein Cas8b1/Cst1 [Tissierellaceae bacterium]
MIEFKISDWRTNVSLLGLMNILDHSNKGYLISKDGQTLSINEKVLDGFEIDYFKYFIDNYERNLPWYRIANYKGDIDKYLGNLSEIKESDLEDINKQIDLVKDYMRRGNYTKVYEFIDKDLDIEEMVKTLKKVNLRKNEEVQDRIDDVELELKLLKEITEYTNTEKAREYMGAKGAIYSFINRGIEGVSFLNPQTREKDIFSDYKKYFIDKLIEYIEEDKKKFKYNCFSCENKIRNLNVNMNLLKDTGFDRTRKSSYIWNHQSDFAICNQCLFLYSCLSAGFYYSMNEGIFINYNYDLNGLKRVNEELKNHSISEINRPENAFSYRTLVRAIDKEYQRHLELEIRDMQIVRYKNEEYRFNLLSKDSLSIISKSKSDLDAIIKAGYKEGRQLHFSIYDLTLDRIFNNENLFSLIHDLIVNLISNRVGIMRYYNIYHISRLLNINSRIIKEGNVMAGDIGKLTDNSRSSGYFLRQAYNEQMKDLKRVDNRMKSITYKMTNSLKTNNSGAFMDILISAYAYVGKPIPRYLADALKSDEELRIVGYAFVTGINSYKKDEGGNEDDE